MKREINQSKFHGSSYNGLTVLSVFFKLEFTPCKAEQPLQGMELQEKEIQKD